MRCWWDAPPEGGRQLNQMTLGGLAMASCPLCDLDDSEIEIVFERKLTLFLRHPRYQGALKHSGIIIPKAHRPTAFDLTPDEWQATRELLVEVRQWIDARYEPAGYNLGWNCWPVGGQEVMHAHLHVIPRFAQEPLAGEGIRSHLKSARNRW
ncbi:MAG: HIT family protein [Planctomycetota bacterium]